MRIIKRSTLAAFWAVHPETRASLENWLRITAAARWRASVDVRASFPKAVVLNGERVRFEVAGGNYRLIVAFRFDLQIAWIKFIGTHAEYDAVDALTVSRY
ncbi:MAG: type II toxin-antitoxin system HigB family toxin [Rhodoblastus sp.]|nr:type II toxin-antitoxin system HigB family toxin [Rhodoblastus sp.]